MAEPGLTDIFGSGATQTASALNLDKADFAEVGLTASATNTAESLLIAILLKAKTYLNEDNTNPDLQIFLEEGLESLIYVGESQYRQKSLTVNLRKLDEITPIDPDDY